MTDLRAGTVTQVAPLLIIPDGETSSAPAVNATGYTTKVGQRVLWDSWNGLTVVLAVVQLDASNRWVSATDTGDLTSGATALSGATIGTQRMRRNGDDISVYLNITLGATISVPADGNVGNTDLATLPVAVRPARGVQQFIGSGPTGPACTFVVANTGVVTLAASVPGATLASGTVLIASGKIDY